MPLRTKGGIYFGRRDRLNYIGTDGLYINGIKQLGWTEAGVAEAAVATRSRTLKIPMTSGKVGATAGWVITAGTDKNHATLPASQTGSTLVIPIDGLQVGDIITAWSVHGQVESAGNAVTVAADLRKLTPAAADNTDASVSTDSAAALVADTLLSAANLGADGLSETVLAGVSYYLLITGTTLGSTDVDLLEANVTVSRPN